MGSSHVIEMEMVASFHYLLLERLLKQIKKV